MDISIGQPMSTHGYIHGYIHVWTYPRQPCKSISQWQSSQTQNSV